MRQWPGNVLDLCFRGVIEACTAVVVSAPPPPGVVGEGFLPEMGYGGETGYEAQSAFLGSDEYKAMSKTLPFCRLWCIGASPAAALATRRVRPHGTPPPASRAPRSPAPPRTAVELSAAIAAEKDIVFICAAVAEVGKGTVRVDRGGNAGVQMLNNFSFMVDVRGAQAAVQADVVRELGAIEASEGGADRVNQVVRQALTAGVVAVQANAPAVDAFRCGEPEALEALGEAEVEGALEAACAAGLEGAVAALLGRGGAAAAAVKGYYPLFIAAANGHVAVVELLLGAEGVKVNEADENGVIPLIWAAQEGHGDMVRDLLGAGALVNLAAHDGQSPLFVASEVGKLEVVGLLLCAGADKGAVTNEAYTAVPPGTTALAVAELNGHSAVAALLR